MNDHKTARNIGLVGVLVIIVAASGYFARVHEEKSSGFIEEKVAIQKAKDNAKSFDYKKLSDSLLVENKAIKIENKALTKSNDLIINAKKFIRNEIKNQNTRIDIINDSTLHYVVDSIARAGFE